MVYIDFSNQICPHSVYESICTDLKLRGKSTSFDDEKFLYFKCADFKELLIITLSLPFLIPNMSKISIIVLDGFSYYYDLYKNLNPDLDVDEIFNKLEKYCELYKCLLVLISKEYSPKYNSRPTKSQISSKSCSFLQDENFKCFYASLESIDSQKIKIVDFVDKSNVISFV